MDIEKTRALSDFYREEFLKHLQCLRENGLVTDEKREAVDQARRRIESDLDRVCWHSDFPAKAEALLRGFDALTRLSQASSPSSN